MRNRYNGLFVKLFIVMVVSIVTVSVLTVWATIRMSEQLFMNTFSIINTKVINQIRTNFETFNYQVVITANDVLQSGTIKGYLTENSADSLTMIKRIYNMEQQMKQIRSNVGAYEASISVLGVNGMDYAFDRTFWPPDKNRLKNLPMTKRALAEPKRLMYQYDREDGDEPLIIASKALMDRTNGFVYGTLYIAVRENKFRQFYTNFTSEGNDVVLLNQEGLIVSSNRSELIGRKAGDLLGYAKKIRMTGKPYTNAHAMGRNSILLADYLPSYDFYLVNIIDKNTAMGQMVNVPTVTMIVAAIVLAALVLVFLITRRMTLSLTLLARHMSNVTKRDFGNHIKVGGSQEIRELGEAFNYMLDELHDYVNKLMQTQRKQRNAELAALQRQINPHFLYNTLASVKMLVQQGDAQKASETVNALITLLQNTISNVSETITVEQEIDNLKNYVFINHVRYGRRIKVNFFIAPDCKEVRLPKLILQPFIENAFFHGFNRKNEGYIHVLAAREGDALICEVIDNGDGMEGLTTEQRLPNPKSRRQLFTGIGIQNVHDRITLLYGEEYGVSIVSKPEEGTRVKVRLPLLQS